MFKRKKKVLLSPELDTKFYSEYYNDLAGKSEEGLHKHWQQFGKNENRSPSLKAFLEQHNVDHSTEIDFDIDSEFYIKNYPDVFHFGVTNNTQAKVHWLIHGQKEGRVRTLVEWMQSNGGYSALPIDDIDVFGIIQRNSRLGIDVSMQAIRDTLTGEIHTPINFCDTQKETAFFYERLGKSFYLSHKGSGSEYDRQAARAAYRMSLYFFKSASVVELLGNTYLDEGDSKTAAHIYNQATQLPGLPNRWLYPLLAQAERKNKEHLAALKAAVEGIRQNPQYTDQLDSIKDYIVDYSNSFAGKLKCLATLDLREDLKNETWYSTDTIYKAYLATYGVDQDPEIKPGLNTNSVLIVGDYHIPQCIRYRIDQKVEQLESQGKVVTCIDWMDLKNHSNDLALHDFVIFYRVPAVPEVIKAIAQVNAAGKISFYEIDDLLFDTAYPASLDTYGGYLSLETHIELRKGMAQFYAAARLCRYGIASTLPLCEKLEKIVKSGVCILHRNGLDKNNQIKLTEKNDQSCIHIFYGSGTQAHNSDFIEQALPSLIKILSTYPQTRLVVVGYLKLPIEFIERFSHQLKQVPPVKSIKAYWSLLQQADINLAVLHDDEINACKSELKWFEAACFGIPSVVSSTKNYRDVLINGQDAFLATSESEWFYALSSLINDSELRQKIADQALAKTELEYSVTALGKQLAAQMEALVTPSNKRKIAIVNVFYPPQAIGGATRIVADNVEVLKELYGDDIELVVFTSDERCTTPYQLSSYQEDNTTVYRSTILHRENMDWHSQDAEMYTLFERFLSLEQPDLVHFHCVQRLTGSVVEATRDAGIPYIVTVHDAWWISDHQFLVDANEQIYPDGHPDRYAPRTLPNNVSLEQSIERIDYLSDLLHCAKEVLTVSEAFAEIYRKNDIAQIKVNRNGISAKKSWANKETSNNPRVVCGHIGGMSAHKGYFLLKEAIEAQQPENIALLLVDHSKEEGFSDHSYWGTVPVTIIGRVAQDRIVDLYRQIDILFAPSIWPESYGLVTREAAACGCWVVASDLGGIGEDVIEGESGFIVKPDLQSLNKVINDIDRDVAKFKSIPKSSSIRLVTEQVEELVGYYGK